MPAPRQQFKLSASTVAQYFKHKCDRLFRWDAVQSDDRERRGIGEDVPKRDRNSLRPAVKLLMQAGDEFERERVQALVERLGEENVHVGDIVRGRGGREVIDSISLQDFAAYFTDDLNGLGAVEDTENPKPPPATTPPQYIAQLNIDLPEASARAFLRRFRLPETDIVVSSARPDLIEVLEPNPGQYRLRIWDYKASPAARHEHFIQVAYYSFLLEHALHELGLSHLEVDTEWGVVRSRQDEPEGFELHPYRLAVRDFLTRHVPELLAQRASEAHYHVCAKCLVCEYVERCRSESDATSDLSRVPYISSDSKRHLTSAGITSHHDLAQVDPAGNRADELRELSHNLSVHLDRHIAAARALGDGEPRTLSATTLQMPYWEDVRVVISAEQDGVTGTCFALGLKTFEGFDEDGKVQGMEEVFIAEERGAEDQMLLDFLRCLNGLLHRVDEENKAIADRDPGDMPAVKEAEADLRKAEAELEAFKTEHPRLHRYLDNVEALKAERSELKSAVKAAKKALKRARNNAEWELRKKQKVLHFYAYDPLDLEALKGALERHLVDGPTALQRELANLVRLFPPDTVLQDAETFRTIPGTVVVSVLRQLVALPVPYLYDLETVSQLYRPKKKNGADGGYYYRPRYGFGWEHSNQVAFERIHDVWEEQNFETRNEVLTPADVLARIERTVRDKLRATDSVVRRLKQQHKAKWKKDDTGLLLLRKEPFQLHDTFAPSNINLLDALQTFKLFEAALDELQTKQLHTLPVQDRAAKLEAIRDLHYLPAEDEEDGNVLWFSFDPACRDAKFSEGDWSLVVTPEDDPDLLINKIDGRLFEKQEAWKHSDFKVELEQYDLTAKPPRVALRPENASRFRDALGLNENPERALVLDTLHQDFLTKRALDVLNRLRGNPEVAQHVASLLQHGTIPGWDPFFNDMHRLRHAFARHVANAAGPGESRLRVEDVLNGAQRNAWRGVFFEPLSMIWGPPGTGKTHTVAHILIGYALAAKLARKPIRVLVTGFTHHAIVNVLAKTARLAAKYDVDGVTITKQGRPNKADAELPDMVGRHKARDLPGAVRSEEPPCLIVGSTVWDVYKSMVRHDRGPGCSFFDVVLIDEASQVLLPDALIALAAAKPSANIILSGDDQQLPPIVRGEYPEEHEHLLSSVFAFARHRMIEREEDNPGVRRRTLFQLTRNYRMNEPLTTYPREAIYVDYEADAPERQIKILTESELSKSGLSGDEALASRVEASDMVAGDTDSASRAHVDTGGLVELVTDPGRPVVLAWYTPPKSFTARNPLEAEVAADIVSALSTSLVNTRTGSVYEPDQLAEKGVAVVAPHRAQNATIRSALMRRGFGPDQRPMPLVDTVEKLQGKQREVIVVSYGVADPEYADAEADFLLSRNRFNVAATRSQAKLIVLCSDVVLDAVPDEQQVLLESMMIKEFRTYCQDGKRTVDVQHPEFGTVPFVVQWKAFSA